MRTIKFRVWSGNMWLDGNDAFINITNPDDIEFQIIASHPLKQYILCQFTGLHDKNGKEIYEGDIIRINIDYDDDTDIPNLLSFRAKIDFQCGAFWFTGIDYGMTDCLWFHYNSEDMEVIGNIYENPELIPHSP